MFIEKNYKRYLSTRVVVLARKSTTFLDDAFISWLLVIIVMSLLVGGMSGCASATPTILPGDVLSLHPGYTANTVKAAVEGAKPLAEAWYSKAADAYMVAWPGPGVGHFSAVCIKAKCPLTELRGMTMNTLDFEKLVQVAKDSGMYKVVLTALPIFADGIDIRDILIFPITPATMDMMGKSN